MAVLQNPSSSIFTFSDLVHLDPADMREEEGREAEREDGKKQGLS